MAAGSHRFVRSAAGGAGHRARQRPERWPGTGVDCGRADRPGYPGLCHTGHRAGRGRWHGPGGDRNGYARRPDGVHARDHQGHPRLAGAGGHLRVAPGRPGRQCRHLYPVRQPHRRHGPGYSPGLGNAGPDGRLAGQRACGTGATGYRHPGLRAVRPGGGDGTPAGWHRDGAQSTGRRGELHPGAGRTPRPERRLGRIGGARRSEPGCPGGSGAWGH